MPHLWSELSPLNISAILPIIYEIVDILYSLPGANLEQFVPAPVTMFLGVVRIPVAS